MANETVMRYGVADYLNVGTDTEEWALCGYGFNTLDENPNAQTEEEIYINDRSSTTTVKSYQTQFPFDTNLVKSEKAVMAIYDIARNQKTGVEAEMDYVRVELFNPAAAANSFMARKFRVSVEVSGIAGSGGDPLKITGNLNGVGDFIDGEFNTATKAFTAVAAETV